MSEECADHEFDILEAWYRKWLDLFELINDVTGSDDPEKYPPPPSLDQELSYLTLREWFLSSQDEFIPLYEKFIHSREDDLPPEDEAEEMEEEYLQNPFLMMYECDNLHQWSAKWDIQDGADEWKPSQQAIVYVRRYMYFFTRQLYEYLYDELLISKW